MEEQESPADPSLGLGQAPSPAGHSNREGGAENEGWGPQAPTSSPAGAGAGDGAGPGLQASLEKRWLVLREPTKRSSPAHAKPVVVIKESPRPVLLCMLTGGSPGPC